MGLVLLKKRKKKKAFAFYLQSSKCNYQYIQVKYQDLNEMMHIQVTLEMGIANLANECWN
ncbi:MAG: hypothetical protein Q8807_03720 ['Waltheria sp.' little leaf phytoplasma]|nr:hypothetical protein ['Waltheria sp.' little leaf phytoplasma]